MSLIIQNEDENENYVLKAKINSLKNVLLLLKSINFKETANVFVSTKGLKITVEDSKFVQANAFIQAEMFQEYFITEEVITFKVNLNVLVECLSILGSGTMLPALKMTYNGCGFPLKLLLEEGGVLTDCSIKTLEPDDTLDFNFSNTEVVNKIIMQSECLKDIFSELDASSDCMEIIMSPKAPYLRISTSGNYGANHVDIPRDSEMIETFSCTQTTKNRYKTCLMRYSVKSLASSQKVLLRCDHRGFICLQFMIVTEDNHTCFIEYFCAPEESYED